MYIHADAAAGGFALLHPEVRSKTAALEKVHSVTIDGHKLGQLPYPNGAVLFRDRGWMYEVLHDAPYLQGLAPTLEGSRPGSHVAALWAAIQDLGHEGYRAWIARLFAFRDRLVAAFRQGGAYQVLHKVDLTTVAVAPVGAPGETRRDLNRLVLRVHEEVRNDRSPEAFLVNIDRGLSGIKVRNRNPATDRRSPEDNSLEDIYCLRIVATNPAVEPGDADRLVHYLESQLQKTRTTR